MVSPSLVLGLDGEIIVFTTTKTGNLTYSFTYPGLYRFYVFVENKNIRIEGERFIIMGSAHWSWREFINVT